MYKLIDFIERHKYGIIITLMVHVAVFVYFQIATYEEPVKIETWDFRGRNVEAPDDIKIDPEQIQTPEEQMLFQPEEKVTAFVRNENDKRKRTFDKEINYTSSVGGVESIEDEFNRQARREILGDESKQRAERESSSNDDIEDSDPKKNNKNNQENQAAGSATAVSGKTMVSYELENRHPLNHNDWHVRNPGYTCGSANGIVRVLIDVAPSGDVVDAKVLTEQSQNASPCMLEKAEKYALKSRFNYDGKAARRQQGIITYRFVYQY